MRMQRCPLCYFEVVFLTKSGVCERCENILISQKIDKGKAIWLRDNKRCRYCGKKVTQKEATIDHIIPKSRGGTNRFDNLVCACSSCNQKKGRKLPQRFGEVLEVE